MRHKVDFSRISQVVSGAAPRIQSSEILIFWQLNIFSLLFIHQSFFPLIRDILGLITTPRSSNYRQCHNSFWVFRLNDICRGKGENQMAFSLSSNSHTSKSGCEMFLETVVVFLIKKKSVAGSVQEMIRLLDYFLCFLFNY